MPASLNRRSFLAGASATTAMAVMLSACSKHRSSSAAPRAVVVSNHPLYIDEATNPGFESATGTPVEYHEDIGDDSAWLAAVTPQLTRGESIDRDVVIVSDWVVDRLDQHGWLAVTPAADAPWAVGMVGIAYDAKATGFDITHAAELFQPPLHGRVALPTDMRLTLGMALLADDVDPAGVTLADATATASRLGNSVKLGQVLPFDRSRPLDRLVAGDAAAAVVVASDTVGLEHEHPDIRFVVPAEGGLLLTDLAVIPVLGPSPEAARRYLDYVSEPVHAAERFRVVPTMWPSGPVDAQLRVTAPEVVADIRRNPSADVRGRLRAFRFLDDTEDRAFRALFDSAIHPGR